MNARSKARLPGTDGGGAFITQRNEKISEIKKEIEDLEALLGSTAPTSQSTLLLKKRKELREVDESLAAVKLDYKKRLEECEERRVGFVNRQARQRDNVIKFEKFIQENESKRKRAEERLRSEVKDYEDYCRVLAKGDAQLAEIDAERNKLLTQLGRVSVYKAFLEKIVEEGEYGYDSPDLILDRYRNLKEVNIDLMEKANASDEELQERTKQFQLLRIESENQVLASKGILTKYQKELKAITLDVKREQNEKDYVEEKKKDLSREYSQVTQSIRNLYVRCQGSLRNASLYVHTNGMNTLMDDLEVIHGRLVDLIEISREHKETHDDERDAEEADGMKTLTSASYMSTSQGPGMMLSPMRSAMKSVKSVQGMKGTGGELREGSTASAFPMITKQNLKKKS